MTNRIKYTFIVLAAAMMLSACKVTTPKKAAEYNDNVMRHQRELVVKYDKMLESFDTYVGSKMDAAYDELLSEVAYTKYEVGQMETPDGCEGLRDAVLEYAESYDVFIKESLPRLIYIYKLPENQFTPEVRMEWENTYKDMDSKLKEAGKKLAQAQQQYANDFKLKITR